METARAANEEPYFGQTGTGNEVSATRFTKPSGWTSNTSSSVSKLSKLTGHTIGPNSLLKVMAGDVINAKADYYYPAAVTNNHNSLITDIVGALVQTITGSSAVAPLAHGNTTSISSELNASTPFAGIADPDKAATDNIPRAYLNIMFFDERFNFVEESSTAVRVSQSGDGVHTLVLPVDTKAPKNGYAYIYLSNENDDAVYFDNFTVSDNRGRIIEENHYYAFGLKIAGISSKKFGDPNEGMLDNKNLYNDKELFDDADLDWYDYGFRNYDPQIGRFTQLDPLTDQFPNLTPYQYASNDPIGNIDIDGLEGGSAVLGHVGDAVVTSSTFMPNIVVQGLSKAAVAQKTFTALNIGINAFKLGANVADHTQNIKTIQSPNLPIYRYKPVLERINDWFRSLNGSGTTPVGSGSHQRVGIVFDGNDGTTDNYTDKADNIVDNIHLGPLFFKMMKAYKPSVTEAVITNETVKKVVNSTDAVSNAGENVYESVHERNKTKVTRGSEGRQVSKTVMIFKYKIGPNGDTLGTSIEPINVPIKQAK